MMSVGKEKQILLANENGNKAYKMHNFDDALKNYEKAIELNPFNMIYLTNIAAIYFEQKQYDICINKCEKAIEIGRENQADFKLIAKTLSRMARAYTKKEDYSNAKLCYQKSLSEYRTTETLDKIFEIEKILTEKERNLNLNTEYAFEQKILGNSLFENGNYSEAIKHYSDAIKNNPFDAKLFSNRAACFQKLEEFNFAIKDCEESIKLDPNFVKGYLRNGYALIALKDYTKARLYFQKAIKIEKNCLEAIEGLQKCLSYLDNSPESMKNRAMANPEVKKILSDPAMRHILEQMQRDPEAMKEHLKNPEISSKIYKLFESGLISI